MASARTAHALSALLQPVARDPRVDQVIANAAPFAQPILRYLRDLIHEAVPDAVEEIKWGRPFFVVNGTSICYVAAFTRHCSLGFWSPEMTAILQSDGVDGGSSSGSVGKITALEDLPTRADLQRYFREAARRARTGDAASPMKARPRTSAKIPVPMIPEFANALARSEPASSVFEALAPSCRREYLDWIANAKRPGTRERRIGQAVAMLESGKRFHEKYRAS